MEDQATPPRHGTPQPERRRPAALRAGDRVRVISPSGPVRPEHVERGVQTLRSWGLEVEVPGSVFDRAAPGYLAGDDVARLAELLDAWRAPEVRGIFCARGGYGLMRLLPALERAQRAQPLEPKVFTGFSDITALHLYLGGVCGHTTLHGPVLKSFQLHDPEEGRSVEALRRAVFGMRDAEELCVGGLETVVAGVATGPLVVGNLSLIAAMVGSRFCPSLAGAILVLEDIAEPDYRLDRLLTTLQLGLAPGERPAAVVLGEFTDCGGVYVPDAEIPAFIAQRAALLGCPVVSRAPVGHGAHNLPLPVGELATLRADAQGATLQVHHDATTPQTHREP